MSKRTHFLEEIEQPIFTEIKHTKKDKKNDMPRSNSMIGLSSLSKSISKQQEQFDELTTIIEHLKDIINKYEIEIKELKDDNKQRDNLIKQYESKYFHIEKSINDIWNS